MIADGIIKASIDSFNGSIPVSSSHLKRIDFSFIVNNFKPIIPAYDISQKYTYHMSGKSVESAFEMHLSDCFHSWLVFPLLQTIDHICDENKFILKETTTNCCDRA